jgi:hypothetical protein
MAGGDNLWPSIVILAKAGIQLQRGFWIPAFAGMTKVRKGA